jgi:hypothetical protein
MQFNVLVYRSKTHVLWEAEITPGRILTVDKAEARFRQDRPVLLLGAGLTAEDIPPAVFVNLTAPVQGRMIATDAEKRTETSKSL